MIQHLFMLTMIAQAIIGFNCARHLTSDYPLWVRLVVLSPSLTAFFTLIAIVQGYYIAFWVDIMRACAAILIYMLIASRFGKNPWLDIRKDK